MCVRMWAAFRRYFLRLIGKGAKTDELIKIERLFQRAARAANKQIKANGNANTNAATAEATADAETDSASDDLPDTADGNIEMQKDPDTQDASGVVYELGDKEGGRFKEYDQPITMEDMLLLRSIGRKSINEFTSEDLEKATKWAYKFYGELGVKSPFFRAWFGDWRAYDKTPVKFTEIAPFNISNKDAAVDYFKNGLKNGDLYRGEVSNRDTGFLVNVGAQVYNDTITYAGRRYSRDRDFNDFMTEAGLLTSIRDLVENAVLFNTEIADKINAGKTNPYKSFVHKLYAICNVNEKLVLAKLTVDELNSDVTTRRAYNIREIKTAPVAVSRVYKPAAATDAGGNNISTYSISDLFALVKEYDPEFKPNPAHESTINIETGLPKVFYHGTDAEWTTYDLQKNKNQWYGEGIYLTPDPNRARLYGDKVMPFYVRATADNREAKRNGVQRDITVRNNGDIIVYSPNQIKSAVDPSGTTSATPPNIGTFSKYDDNIVYSLDDDDAETNVGDTDVDTAAMSTDVKTPKSKPAKKKYVKSQYLEKELAGDTLSEEAKE